MSSCAIGISFLGTPHYGTPFAEWAKFGTTITKIVKQAKPDIESVLQPGSEVLGRIQDNFHKLISRRKGEGSEIALTYFYEELPLPVFGKVRTTVLVVFSGSR